MSYSNGSFEFQCFPNDHHLNVTSLIFTGLTHAWAHNYANAVRLNSAASSVTPLPSARLAAGAAGRGHRMGFNVEQGIEGDRREPVGD